MLLNPKQISLLAALLAQHAEFVVVGGIAVNVRFGPREDRVDILPSIGQMHFDSVWRDRMLAQVEALQIPFISKADLIQNKLEIGRHRDLADVEELTAFDDELFPHL